jgi:hypothetical protein
MMVCAIVKQRERSTMLQVVLFILIGAFPNNSLSSVVTIFMKFHI